MRAVDLIIKKRDGEALSEEELRFFCAGVCSGEVRDYQASAFLMAVYLRGMTDQETIFLTDAMANSGAVVDLSDIPGVKVDKHSTGGVGDTTTLIVAPLVAACGAIVAKMSGRGLGHTGGTLDKLEAIPGVNTTIGMADFKAQVRRIGLAVIGQTEDLVPADRKFYAIRDVTGTVDSIPLIASSIMSKKIAAGADAIVLDVKCGTGAFMHTPDQARELARQMVAIGERLGRRVRAVITRMDAPLGARIGNALEVREAVDVLRGEVPQSALTTVSLTLCAHLLEMAGLAGSLEEGRVLARQKLESGAGLEKFQQMVEAQGGRPGSLDELPRARQVIEIRADRTGYVARIDALKIGNAAALLGAGRFVKDDVIDAAVGVVLRQELGASVSAGDVLAELHVNETTRMEEARSLANEAFRLTPAPVPLEPLILDTVTTG